MKETPNYYAVIPADIRYNKNLKDKAKFLYGEITALCNKDGYCFANNQYFAELYNVTKETISRLLSQLQKEGFIKITIEYDEETKEVKRRLIYLLTKLSIPIDKNIKTSCSNEQYPIDKNVKDNITSINNTINILCDFYNKLEVFPKINKITEKRKAKIKARLKDVGYDNLIKAMEKGSKTKFLIGGCKNSNWRADLDWFIANDTNAIKVLEGKYDNDNLNNQIKERTSTIYGTELN